ncbi:MAG: endolytic transglycosylase MltG, partial [Lachnospiraceae bacterium]|nr:endolytic transglycosylase MltG [Lachnospiraceae bacterium]
QAPEETPGTQEASSAGQSESVRIEVVSGDSSVTVCKKLAQAGLVESASEYDSYLCGNGYDKSIRAGVFEIPVDAGEKEIAEIITKTK